METIEILMEFFGGLVFMIGFGFLIGHLLKLDKFLNGGQTSNDIHLRRKDDVIKNIGK